MIAGMLFIGTVVVYANLIQPAAVEVGAQRQLVFSKSAMFASQYTAVDRVRELIIKFQGTAKLQDTMDLVMPLTAQTTELLNQIQAIARSSQVSLESFSLSFLPFESGRSSLVRRLGVLQVGLSVSGSYASVQSFFRALERNVRLLSMERLDIRVVGGVRDVPSDIFIGDATVRAYYQP